MTARLKQSRVLLMSIAGICAFAGWSNVPAVGQAVSAAEEPAFVAMAGPTTAPAATPDIGRDNREGRDGMRGGGFRGQGWPSGGNFGGLGGGNPSNLSDIPDGGEWKQISSFMVDHSPHRWAYYNRLQDGPRQQGMMRMITRAFRSVQKAQTDDPNLGSVIVQRIEAEDAVFGVVMDMRQARKGGDPERARSFSGDLTAKVTALIDVSFKERQVRVDVLQKTLDDLKTRLAVDEKNRDGVITARVQMLSTQRMGSPGPGDATIASPVETNSPPRADFNTPAK